MRSLEGRVAVVTGGAGGIGLAVVRRFLSAGAFVAVWDPKALVLGSLGAEWPGRLHMTTVDVRKADAVRAAASVLLEKAGRVDILVNNAGVNVGARPTVDLAEADWRAILDTNLTGVLHCVQALAPGMIARRWGRIVNVTSILAEYGHPGHAAYVASKSAIAGVTRSWAREFGRSGVTVNAVRPGYIDTAMNAGTPPQVVEQVVAATPLGRLGQPDDVAGVIAWLSSTDAAFVTGAVIPVDGGLIL